MLHACVYILSLVFNDNIYKHKIKPEKYVFPWNSRLAKTKQRECLFVYLLFFIHLAYIHELVRVYLRTNLSNVLHE